jgi:hypothetical protein
MTLCRCNHLSLLWDRQADDYASHLVPEGVSDGGAGTGYRCPATGKLWVAEFAPDASGVTTYRLTRLMHPGELVEFLAREGDVETSIAFSHPDVEFRPLDSRTIYHGIDEARRQAALAAADPNFPRATPVSLIEAGGDDILVLGSVAYRRDGDFNEHRPAAWVVTVQRGQIVRSIWFDSWKKARRSAGLPDEGGPPIVRLGQAMFSVVRGVRLRPRST